MRSLDIGPSCRKMDRAGRNLIFGCMAVLLLWPAAAHAQGNGGGGNSNRGPGRPVSFETDNTPLQKAVTKKIDECKAAADRGEVPHKSCRTPKTSWRKLNAAECPDCGDLKDRNGKVVGKKTATETVLDFDKPGQGGKNAWDRVSLAKNALAALGQGGTASPGGRGARVRSAGLLADAASNDDKDCIDRLSGEHKGGATVPDGGAGSCFDANGVLLATLTPINGGCAHANGTLLSGDPDDGVEDDCYDAGGNLKTTLQELMDEDGPDAIDDDFDGSVNEDPSGDADGDGDPNDDHDCVNKKGKVFHGAECQATPTANEPRRVARVDEDGPDRIDQDGDGSFDEDPPAGSLAEACRNFGAADGLAGLAEPAGEDGCDFTRAVIVAANKAAAAAGKTKVFKADENGNPDPEAEGTYEYGQEHRRMKLTETYAIRCRGNAELVEGQCMEPPRGKTQGKTLARGAALAASAAKAADTISLSEAVMMGFTFAPPAIEWGYKIEEEACILDWCFEVFFARVGYEFDLSAGLRLPVEVRVSEVPDPSELANAQVTLETELQPLDFKVSDYKEFCEKHRLNEEWYIADCDKFSFPEFLDSLNPFTPAAEKDGSEFVLQETVFAGVQVRIAQIPVIDWAIDSHIDLPAACTILKINQEGIDLLSFGKEAIETGNLIEALKNSAANCASFETPFGYEENPFSTSGKSLRAFPFSTGFDIRADCVDAVREGETLKVGNRVVPLCTGLVLGANGASLGVGLGIEVNVGSKLIEADWSAREDASGGGTLDYEHAADEDDADPSVDVSVPLGPFRADNYNPADFADFARLTLSDFTYYLNAMEIALKANFEFGGILDPIPDLGSFTIYSFTFDIGDKGIPIGQHPGTEDMQLAFFVENYALELDAHPFPGDANRKDENTLEIKPGQFGDFQVEIENRGSVAGDFDRFGRELSNRRDQSAGALTFVINPNTDFDCKDAAGQHYRGNPYDGTADDCYGPGGAVRSDRTELIDEDDFGPEGELVAVRDADGDGVADEDPPDVWETRPDAVAFSLKEILAVPPYTRSSGPSSQPLTLGVKPFRHPLTAPGLYPLRLTADSRQARTLGLPARDASGNARLGASDVVYVQVSAFFDPLLALAPRASAHKPGLSQAYLVEGSNGGNVPDTLRLGVDFLDFNQAGCTLTTLGTIPGCPFRAVPTQIPAMQWTTASSLPSTFGPFDPLDSAQGRFTVSVPRDWAGMQDTTYEIVLTAESMEDPDSPPARRQVVVRHTVVATKESMTRYIGLEIAELIAEIEKANTQGIATSGLLPISVHPILATNDRALQRILAGDLAGASHAHAANIKITQGFLRALASASRRLPAAEAADWKARGEAIVRDLTAAEASQVASAP